MDKIAIALAEEEEEEAENGEKEEEPERKTPRAEGTKGSELTPASSSPVSSASDVQRSSSTWYIVRKHPLLLVCPTLLFILIVALCVFGVTYATDLRIETQVKLAEANARDTADALRLQISVASGAVLQLATFVMINPAWDEVEEDFIPVAKEIFHQADQASSYRLAELIYAPFGVISANWAPPDRFRGPVRLDMFSEENLDRLHPYATLELGSMTVNGPLPLSVGGLGLIARYPIFIQNVSRDEDFNNPYNMTAPTGCDERCYDEETRTKFWGFSGGFFYADSIVSGEDERLQHLRHDDYEYRLAKNGSDKDGDDVIVKNEGWDDQEPTAVVAVRIPGAEWSLALYNPETTAIKQMRDGLIAMIVILAFLLSGLLLMLLISNKKAALLLQDQLVTNGLLENANSHLTHTKMVLEEEKQQREALLSRQYDLISCFERKGSRRLSGKSSSMSVAEKQQHTLEQIAALRRHLDEERGQRDFAPTDDRFFELLGEGTFGKVHRGKWRSTDVAIKTIMLPANMSGAEKREKMVVWEAAISSSLTHPNIVQTYTYSIKPVRENEKHSSGQKTFESSLGSAIQICRDSEGSKQGDAPATSDKSSEGGTIHSFEVSLVLEYCDKSTLRDALDQGAFMSGTGLNYAAILDSAEDVARAMLHLHCNNILHMDLKARNIMLASSGTEGRGVTCKASDFGLAVRMEHSETHMSGFCQGTLTHMAPETLLKGQVSKAADVYSYGILLWELFTAGQPYKGIPKALLGHKVCKEGHRPPLPFVMPHDYQALVQACWARDPEKRPTFVEILARLQGLRQGVPGPTPPLGPISKPMPKLYPGGRFVTGSPQRTASKQLPEGGSQPGSPFASAAGGCSGRQQRARFNTRCRRASTPHQRQHNRCTLPRGCSGCSGCSAASECQQGWA